MYNECGDNVKEISAVFLDKKGNLNNAIIKIEDEYDMMIIAYNESGKRMGDIKISFSGNKRIFVHSIYCHYAYRNLGIGQALIDLFETLIYRYQDHVILGNYYPFEEIEDNKVSKLTKTDLAKMVLRFYDNNNYKVISYEEHEKYPPLNRKDFLYGDIFVGDVVYKKVSDIEEPRFEFVGEVLFDKFMFQERQKKRIK